MHPPEPQKKHPSFMMEPVSPAWVFTLLIFLSPPAAAHRSTECFSFCRSHPALPGISPFLRRLYGKPLSSECPDFRDMPPQDAEASH